MAAIHHPPPSSHPVVNGERRLPRLKRHHRCVGVRILTKTTVLLRYAGQIQLPTTISQPNLAAAVVAVVDLPLPDTPHDIDSPARCSSRPPLSTTILFDCYIVVLSLFRCPPLCLSSAGAAPMPPTRPHLCLSSPRRLLSRPSCSLVRSSLVLPGWLSCHLSSCHHLPSACATVSRRAASSARGDATAKEGHVNYDVSDVPVEARAARTTAARCKGSRSARARRCEKLSIFWVGARGGGSAINTPPSARRYRACREGSWEGVESCWRDNSVVPCGGHKASRRWKLHHRVV